jgi:hypothetical protein
MNPPSLPTFSGLPPLRRLGGGEGWGNLLALALLLAVSVLVARFALRTWQARLARQANLGPWPVRPEDVSTAEQLVRAFEYLAILCLGPTARPRNHHDLAERLSSQDVGDSARRKEAVHFLVRLYEQARYAPEGLPLAPDLVDRVRRELSYLAGVSAS